MQRLMNRIITILTFLILVSCGQENTNNDGQTKESDQMPIETPKTAEIKKEETKVIGTGKITTIADGYDVQRVNLFSTTSPDRTINCFLTKGDKVNILEDADPYYLVEKVDKKECKGYCMKEFVIIKK